MNNPDLTRTKDNELATYEFDRQRVNAEAAIENCIEHVVNRWHEMPVDFSWSREQVLEQLNKALELIKTV